MPITKWTQMTLGTFDIIGNMAQMILVWVSVTHLPMRIAQNTMGTTGTQNNTQDLWRHR
jgi:hypothetical protein